MLRKSLTLTLPARLLVLAKAVYARNFRHNSPEAAGLILVLTPLNHWTNHPDLVARAFNWRRPRIVGPLPAGNMERNEYASAS